MNEKELKELQDQIKAEQKKASDAIAELKTAQEKDKNSLFEKWQAADTEAKALGQKLDKAIEKLNQMGLDLKEGRFEKAEDPMKELKAFFTDKAKVQEAKKAGRPLEFELKVAGIMTSATNLSGSVYADRVVVPYREPGVGKAPDRVPTLLDLITRGTINSDMDTWVERSARTMSAASVAEGSKYALSDLTYVNKSQKVERIGHYFKVQNIALEDWDQLLSEINLEGFTGLEREIERQVFVGTGTTPEMQGITDSGIAAAFSATGLNALITGANNSDAIRAAIMQIRQAEYSQGLTAFVNPVTGALMDLQKDEKGMYVLPPFSSANNTIVKGCPIIESNLVTAGDLLIGDFKKVLLLMKRGITVRFFDQNEDDALYDRSTITVSCRAVNRIKTPDYNAFVYDSINDIIDAIKYQAN